MDELKAIEVLKNKLGFSDLSIKKLKKFHNYLLEYNKRYNLISKKTEKSIWIRHILDSAQIIKFIDVSKDQNIVDFGSGAGFPGLIIAFYNENKVFHVKLYEKSKGVGGRLCSKKYNGTRFHFGAQFCTYTDSEFKNFLLKNKIYVYCIRK